MTTTISLPLNSIEEVSELLIDAADFLSDFDGNEESVAAMRYHGLTLLKRCQERREEVFGKQGDAGE